MRWVHPSLVASTQGTGMGGMTSMQTMYHGNLLGRAQTIYGDTTTVNPTFGQVVAATSAANALPSLANIDPPRMFQFQVRYSF